MPLAAAFSSAPVHAVTTPSSGSRDPMAFVAEFSGKVEVARGAAKTADPVTLGLPLRRGDKIQVGPGGAATLLFNDGDMLELPERTALTIGARPAAKKGGNEEVMAGVFKSVSQGVVGGTRETGLVALAPVRGGGTASILIVAPRQTELLDDRPAFRWHAVPGATRYKVALAGESGPLWERETTDSTLAYPADAAALARESDVTWELSAFGASGVLRKETSDFRIKSEADATEIRRHLGVIDGAGLPEGRSRDFLAGAYLAGQGLLEDASTRFASLCADHPDEPAAHEALGRIYRAVGRSDEAAAELQKALALTRKP